MPPEEGLGPPAWRVALSLWQSTVAPAGLRDKAVVTRWTSTAQVPERGSLRDERWLREGPASADSGDTGKRVATGWRPSVPRRPQLSPLPVEDDCYFTPVIPSPNSAPRGT